MASFVLLPGAGGAAAYWHLVVDRLRAAGHEAQAVGFPGADPAIGVMGYADLAIGAVGDRTAVTLVAQSMGGFPAAQVAQRVPDRLARVVFVNAMIPAPGETAGAWWENVGAQAAREAAAREGGWPVAFDLESYFLHDLPRAEIDLLMASDGEEAPAAFDEPSAFTGFPPGLPLHVIAGKDDRFFPAAFQARVARERLDAHVELLPGGHLLALSHPAPLAARLMALAGG